jgi:hypothetical protein
MCDYSLQNVRSRPAAIGDNLVTHNFGTGTLGFAAAKNLGMAVCLLPGTEIAFPNGVRIKHRSFWLAATDCQLLHGDFRQINKQSPRTHHDAVEFADGHTVLLTNLPKGQLAAVLQLPAEPVTPIEAEAQKRAAYFG